MLIYFSRKTNQYFFNYVIKAAAIPIVYRFSDLGSCLTSLRLLYRIIFLKNRVFTSHICKKKWKLVEYYFRFGLWIKDCYHLVICIVLLVNFEAGFDAWQISNRGFFIRLVLHFIPHYFKGCFKINWLAVVCFLRSKR